MTFRVLSIDGGGMRGIYTSTFLAEVERSFSHKRGVPNGLDIGKAFQLIVGTSTGAIIGCGLVKGVDPSTMAKMYKDHGASIFPKKIPSSVGVDLACQIFTRPGHLKQGDAALRSALEEVFGGTTLRQIWEKRHIALAVTAVNMSNFRSWVFKTPHDPESNSRDDNYTLVDICQASSAAPLFRSLAAIDNPDNGNYDVFADGGLWANNPVIVALIEALRMMPENEEEIEIFCLGSCGKPEGDIIKKDAVHRGLSEWKFGGVVAGISIAAQEFAFDMVARMLLPHLNKKIKIIRFPANKIPGAMLQYLDLDETRPEGIEALIRQARHDADTCNSEIQSCSIDGVAIRELFNSMPARPANKEEI
ncbi:MAG: patatin-like phospholipase family protein [Deltaproteobacteria bacterium]|nr:patatin-like phospholipase family protein [Deltaproteobacteria bacterium]